MIYQLKIALANSNPEIWRRIQVAGDTAFSDLHDNIQLSMGWEHDHLYEFAVKNIRIYDLMDFNSPNFSYQRPDEPIGWPRLTVSKPFIKEKTPGRTDPCPCGSGKKYKKCCIDKE